MSCHRMQSMSACAIIVSMVPSNRLPRYRIYMRAVAYIYTPSHIYACHCIHIHTIAYIRVPSHITTVFAPYGAPYIRLYLQVSSDEKCRCYKINLSTSKRDVYSACMYTQCIECQIRNVLHTWTYKYREYLL